jgi:hypothetical protein
MGTSYNTDIVAWANEQAALLRAGRLDVIDTFHIAEEIDDVGKSQQQALINRLAVLVAHLLKWKFQQGARSAGWNRTMREQRKRANRRLRSTPSLKNVLSDADSRADIWSEAIEIAQRDTGLLVFPEDWIWTIEQVLDEHFFPD